MATMTPRMLIGALCAWSLACGAPAARAATPGVNSFVMMSEEQEIKVGEQVAKQVMQQYRAYDNHGLQEYVQAIGEKVAKVSDRPNLTYTFTILDTEEVNAFAVPGGHIFVARGLLAYLNSEAELAGVLGHEIGHVAARHAAKQHSTAAITDILARVTAMATGVPGSDLLTGFLGKAFISGYGRDMELEADHLGAEYMQRAGYPPDALIRVISVLKDQEEVEIERAKEELREPHVYHGLFATHPDQDTRLHQAIDVAGAAPPLESPIVNRHTYLHFIDGMVYGKNDAERAAIAGTYVHPTLGIMLKLPLGWEVQSGKNTLLAKSPAGDAALHVGVQPLQGRPAPADFLAQRVGKVELIKQEPLSSGGVPGFTAIALAAPSPFGTRPVRYGVVYVGDKAFVLAGAAESTTDPYEYDREFVQAIQSLRPMTKAEQRMAAPAIVRVLQVEPGTSVEELAGESRLPKHAEQEIRLINGLYPSGEPTPGDYVKALE
jgi:predicted Zn-dependent protease